MANGYQCLVHGKELDGVHILSKKFVESFFTNQLLDGMTLSHLLVEAFDRPANASQRSIFDNQDTHSLAWTIEANPSECGYRSQGVGSWAGIFNTYYTIDWGLGVVIVSFFQLLPFNDGEAYELYRIFEDLVYEFVLQ